MKIQRSMYGSVYYGWGNKYFYIWISDDRKSTLDVMPKTWKLNCLGLFKINITALYHNIFKFYIPRWLKI